MRVFAGPIRGSSVALLVVTLASGCTVARPSTEATLGTSGSSSPSAATTPAPSPTPTSSPTPRFGQQSIAQVVTTDLVVRSAPGTGSDSKMYDTRLASPTLLYIFDGPVSADGYDWYLVLPRNLSFLPSGYEAGWVAAAGKDGEAWIGDATPQCPEPTLEEIVALSDVAMLACFGSQSLGLEGWISKCSARDPAIASPYIWASRCHVEDSGYPVDVVPSPGGLAIWFDGDIGAQPSAQSRLSRIT